jgi:ElaA protein
MNDMKPEVQWQCLHFNEMTRLQVYQVLQLRSAVFVLEQACAFLDPDNKDMDCYHVLGFMSQQLVATARLLPAGLAYQELSIGRVATHKEYRRNGIGIGLMQHAIFYSEQLFSQQPIKIGAQLYLRTFYEKFGFIPTSNVYLEDGIEHIEMLRP